MVAIFSLLVVVVVSMLVVRVATVALTLTGLSQQLARFQARSAFTGAGFTTAESEKVVQHPVRRRIIMLLMLLGNAGVVTAISSLILSFVNTGERSGFAIWVRILVLLGGLAVLWMAAHSQWIDKRISRLIAWALKRWTNLEVRDYAGLLHLGPNFAVAELQVQPGDWLSDRSLAELRLSDEGVLVLGIEKPDGTYLGAPRGDTRPMANDTLILYGPRDTLADLDRRRAGREGAKEHRKAIERQHQLESEESAQTG